MQSFDMIQVFAKPYERQSFPGRQCPVQLDGHSNEQGPSGDAKDRANHPKLHSESSVNHNAPDNLCN